MSEQAMTREEATQKFFEAYQNHDGEWEAPGRFVWEALRKICDAGEEDLGIECRLPIAINLMFAELCAAVGGQLQEMNPDAYACLQVIRRNLKDLEERNEEAIATIEALDMLNEMGAEVTITTH